MCVRRGARAGGCPAPDKPEVEGRRRPRAQARRESGTCARAPRCRPSRRRWRAPGGEAGR
eukprot:6759074-Alexandrium_andersonii.AAC.1